MKDLMKRNTKIAAVLCLTVLGTAIEARADCQHVRGSITSSIVASPNDPFGRVLGNVDGVLKGASTAFITSLNPPPAPFIVLNASWFDVFVTKRGDMLTASGAAALTPVPGKPPGEFTENAILTITGGSGSTPELPARSRSKNRVTTSLAVPVWEPSMWFIKVPSAVRILKPTETEPFVDKVGVHTTIEHALN